MDKISLIILMIGITLSLVSVISMQLNKKKVDYILNSLDSMLDAAINNRYVDASYDETKISALESKLSRYLGSSIYSAKNLDIERNRMKELISDISHQTKTPITNILLYVQLLQENPDVPENANMILHQIYSQSEKLSFLIQSLINLSRLENNMIEINVKEQLITLLLDEVYIDNKETASKKDISFHISKNEDVVAIFDLKWTREALNNIVENAMKYTPNNGVINISVIKYEMFCRIDIKDTGIGIDKEEQNAIFQRFYRSPVVQSYEGVGIGLYLTRKILSAQGGYIKVNSIPGEGSIFSVFLPLKKM